MPKGRGGDAFRDDDAQAEARRFQAADEFAGQCGEGRRRRARRV